MQSQRGYGAADVPTRRPQHHPLFPPPESFPPSSNFPIPISSAPSILDMDPQHQVQMHHQFHLFRNQHHHHRQQQQLQHQQPSGMIGDPLSNFRHGGIGLQNGGVSPHNLIGLVSGDDKDLSVPPFQQHGQNVTFDAGAIPKQTQIWRYDQNGMAEQQLEKFPRLERQVFSPNFRQLGSVYSSQAPEFDNQASGSASEIHENHNRLNQKQLEFPNPNAFHINRGETELKKNKCKCSSTESNTNEEDEDKKLERQLEVMARAFEDRILAHQERLYERFMAKIDNLEKERNEREESWRAAEEEKAKVQAASRSAALSREAVIVSYLERITGEKIHLPNPSPPPPPPQPGGGGRWPRAEVEALVRVRSELETKFREQGQKAVTLWEEVSNMMGKMGYERSAKRCKEKWENINKYYSKKTKDEGREEGEEEEEGKRPKRRLKTCSYFDQLNKLYSRPGSSYINNTSNVESKDCEDRKGNGEENQLLSEAVLDIKSNVDPSQSKSEEEETEF